ncbi:hypothetical protein pdam_00013005 [Pocillopora damicornis]|uniref:Uncharacterized protein n=1 Tax=Pocillopora damicornis TaxID=46731 RepID=A0A3M6U5D0_POCDA|nr:hypothetical protein pdam_00013005 [Pocillopora damicornis]
MDSIWSSTHRCKQRHKRPRYYKTPVAYYSNSIAIQRLVQTATSRTQKSKEKTNAKRNITKFDCCEKTIRRNQASITCCGCIGSFLKCSGLTASSSTWLCSNCLGFALPFYKCSEAEIPWFRRLMSFYSLSIHIHCNIERNLAQRSTPVIGLFLSLALLRNSGTGKV